MGGLGVQLQIRVGIVDCDIEFKSLNFGPDVTPYDSTDFIFSMNMFVITDLSSL